MNPLLEEEAGAQREPEEEVSAREMPITWQTALQTDTIVRDHLGQKSSYAYLTLIFTFLPS